MDIEAERVVLEQRKIGNEGEGFVRRHRRGALMTKPRPARGLGKKEWDR
jgi:hypothetical protein